MKFSHQANKSLGQHFLVDPKTIQRIINACALNSDDHVLEIGPGKGALTRSLALKVAELTVIEKDKELARYLKEDAALSGVNVIYDDVLNFDWRKIKKPIKVIGNLPYNVATPIIEKIIHNRDKVSAFYFMVQLEHGQRLMAGPHSKSYGSLSCFIQYYAVIKKLFHIKRTCFRPSPKVDSCFMSLHFLDKPRYECANEDLLFEVIRASFNYRRKTLLNSLSFIYQKEELLSLAEKVGVNLQKRAEDLELQEYVALAGAIERSKLKRGS